MAQILTAEDVVQRIAAECAYVEERGGVGIRLEPAAAIVDVGGNAPDDILGGQYRCHHAATLTRRFASNAIVGVKRF